MRLREPTRATLDRSRTLRFPIRGHAAEGVTAQHYAAQNLELLRAAVASIVLDVSTAQIVALPVRAVAGRAGFAVLLAGAPRAPISLKFAKTNDYSLRGSRGVRCVRHPLTIRDHM